MDTPSVFAIQYGRHFRQHWVTATQSFCVIKKSCCWRFCATSACTRFCAFMRKLFQTAANGGNLHQRLKPQLLTHQHINTDSGWQWFLKRVILSSTNITVSDVVHMKERKKTSSWQQDVKVFWWLLAETRDDAEGRETFIYCSLTFVRVSRPCSSSTPLSLSG